MRKFAQLAKLCSYVVSVEGRRVRRIQKILRPDIPLAIESGRRSATTIIDCLENVYRADKYFNQLKEKKQLMCDDKQGQRELSGSQRKGN